jgi:prolyl-tRNA editing enzyme YbaK/EbsC (Cys-tRNA(Pro) deacylase)
MLNEKDLKSFLEERYIDFEIVKFEKSVISSENAASQTNGTIVKSILLICDGNPTLFILLGKNKIDFEKVKKEIGFKDVRLAKAKEVREITGYDIGALPPLAHKQKIKTIIDKKVNELNDNEIIYCGGGSHYHLLKIRKKELIKILSNVEIKDVAQ